MDATFNDQGLELINDGIYTAKPTDELTFLFREAEVVDALDDIFEGYVDA